MPYSRLQTDFRDMSNRPFNGWMLAVLNSPIKLPEGVEILNQRFEYPVKDGVAYDDDALTVLAELPATDTAIPADTLVSIFLKDATGRLLYHGAFVIPEMTNNEPIPLASLSNLDPSGGAVMNVASIGGLTGEVLVAGQVAIDQNTNTLVFQGLRFRGPWDGDSTFFEGDVVRHDDRLWVAHRENTGSVPAPSADWSLFLEPPPVIVPEPTGIAWRGAWQSGATYVELDAVEYQGQAYVCLQPHQAAASNAPADGSAYWKLFAAKGIGINWQGPWDSSRAYQKGDAVEHQGSSYYATADMPANNPPGSSQPPLPAGNVALSNAGVAVGTGSTSGHGPEMAFDGDANTYWEASTGSGYYDTVGLANVWGGVLREVTSVVIRQHETQYHTKIGGILIEHTTDGGVTWQDTAPGVQVIPNNAFGEQTVVLPAPVKCNGMRVKAGSSTTAGGSAYTWRIYELKFIANELPGAPLWDLIASKGADGQDAESLAINDLSDVTIASPQAGQVLKFDGTTWVNDADATGGGASDAGVLSRVYKSAGGGSQAVANTAQTTKIMFDTVDYDAGGNAWSTVNNEWTVPVNGDYEVVCGIQGIRDTSGTNQWNICVNVDGAERARMTQYASVNQNWASGGHAVVTLPNLAAGAKVDIRVGTANNLTVQTGQYVTWAVFKRLK